MSCRLDNDQSVIGSFSARVGLEPALEGDLVDSLVHASRNRFGLCIENTLAALETAVLQGAPRLETRHFAEAWGMQEGCNPGQNVFLSPRWAQIDLGDDAAAPGPAKARARR